MLRIVFCALVGCFGGVAVASVAAEDASIVERDARSAVELAREITADGSYQRSLPEADRPPEIPSWLGSLGPLASWLLYALGLSVVIVVLVWLARQFGIWRRAPVRQAVSGADLADRLPGQSTSLETATRLAEQGRFGEAAHQLLLAAIQRITRASRVTPASSRTSRELRRLLPLDGEARRAFGELVLAVESAHFGGAELDADDYAHCMELFRSSTGWQGQ